MADIILSERTRRILDEAEYNNACPLNPFAVPHRRNATVWAHALDGTIFGVGSSCPRDNQGNTLPNMVSETVLIDEVGFRPEIVTSSDYEAIDDPTADYCKERIKAQIREWRKTKSR